MKTCLILTLIIGALPTLAASVVYESNLAESTGGWTVRNYQDAVRLECCEVAGQPALKLTRIRDEGSAGCAFRTKEFAVKPGGYTVSVAVCNDVPRIERANASIGEDWSCHLAWLDANGEETYPAKTYSLVTSSNGWTDVKFGGEVPASAVSARLSIGVSGPSLREGRFVALNKVVVRLYPPPNGPDRTVSLRDDGMTLIGGKPFFPIGMYSVQPCERNGNSIERAFKDLKALGFNVVHTYNTEEPDEMRTTLDAAAREGLKMFVPTSTRAGLFDPDRVMSLRNHPAVIAWYLDDDTSLHASPESLIMRNFACKELDIAHPTCQADGVADYGTRYSAFVHGADVFLPELYPVAAEQPTGREVAKTGLLMDHISAANAYAHAPVKSTWAIVQDFDGWDIWQRFPTLDELRASSFAALVHGARGYTLYCYGNDNVTCSPAEWKKRNPNGWDGRGCANKTVSGHWDEMCAVVRQIAPLAKDLASRDAAEQPSVEITAGPKKDACGVAAVSCLLKETGLLMAVNSTTNAVSVRLSVGRGNDFEVVERTFRPYEVFVANLHHKVSESKVCNENN